MLRLTAAIAALGVASTVAATAVPPARPAVRTGTIDSTILKALKWRNIGPERAGRSIAISGVKGQPKVGYAGAAGGGLWKTTDGGTTWMPITDGQLHSASVGAVAVSESNPDIVYIGMGEACIRGDIMAGDGVYKSVDAGKTWNHVGFGQNQTISKIRIDPRNPDVVFVAAFGNYSAPNEERGVYKTTDGGKTWRKILYHDDKTAAVDLSLDRHNPDVIYAALWEAMRNEWTMSSGGPGSGLYKSVDGGEHWQEITRNPGLPAGIDGKIGVSVSGADPNRVYAEIENENGGLFRSDDAGATWILVNSGHNIRQRAFYYTHVTADPHDKDLVYVQNVGTLRSTDGGKTMTNYAGSDSHDMWIDPDDSQHLLYANDGGGTVTFDALGAHTFSPRTYSTAQLYHVVATAHVPYQVCGAQQDASTICVPSNAGEGRGGRGGGGGRGGAPNPYAVGGAEPGYIAPDPNDPDVFYAGGNNGSFLTRLDRRSGEEREVSPYPLMFSGEPSSALVERWQWTYPIVFSPVDPKTLYAGSQHVWRTINGGETWDRISPDLTRHDPATMGHSGGPITGDMNGPEVYAVVFAIGPSKRDVNVLWAGSDDGMIHVTRNAGKSWADVTPKEMPAFGRVSIIDASAFDAGTAYAAVKRPLLNDDAPYIFRTHDFGQTWTRIVHGIAPDDYVHAVREDSTRRGLLYAATQHGVYISYDDGDNWQSLSLNLPDVPVSDLIVQGNSLAISTHGRGFYILDNLEALRQVPPGESPTGPLLLRPAAAIRGAGGARIAYWLTQAAERVAIEVTDAKGDTVFTTASGASGGRGAPGAPAGGRGRGRASGPPTAPGINAVTWDLRYPDATTFPGMILWGATTGGPLALPGQYTVRLTVDGKTATQPLIVLRHPLHRDATDADLALQFAMAIRIRDKMSEANAAVIQLRALKSQITDRAGKANDSGLKGAADSLTAALSAVEEAIYQVRNQSGQDPLNYPIKLNNRLGSLLGSVESGDGKPTGNIAPIFDVLSAQLKVQLDQLHRIVSTQLPAFNARAARAGMPPIAVFVDRSVPRATLYPWSYPSGVAR
ncbi:MAG TPA: glycosyl hydrolase [Gemmatimonadales bacterium]|jgi:photosystem II stability/assembly factor-like uncharacterized protein